MNQGGEHGHDDYGLPRVDIEIPDDARELFRDVQAYHRELRAVRRHQRSMRLRAPFRRSGVAIPLLAGCLIAALVAVMVSAMFTANPYFRVAGQQPSGAAGPGHGSGSAGSRSARSASSPGRPRTSPSNEVARPSPATKPAISRLPGRSIRVAGKPLGLRTLSSAALAIVPANCDCAAAVRQLLAQAESAQVPVYLVGPRGSSLIVLNRLATASPAGTQTPMVAADDHNVLTSTYRTVGFTVLLVDSHGSVTVDSGLRPGLMLEKQLQLLRPAG